MHADLFRCGTCFLCHLYVDALTSLPPGTSSMQLWHLQRGILHYLIQTVYSGWKELFDHVLGSSRIKIRFEANAGNIIGRKEGFQVDKDWVLKPPLELSCIKGPLRHGSQLAKTLQQLNLLPVWRDEMECAVKVHDCRNGFGGSGLEEDSRQLKGRTRRNKQYNKQIGHWPCSGTGQSIIQCAMHTLL